MNVDVFGVWKVVVDNNIDGLEIHSATHDVSADQSPDAPSAEAAYDSIALHVKMISKCQQLNTNINSNVVKKLI